MLRRITIRYNFRRFTSFSLTSDSTVSLTTHTTNALTSAAFTENDINTLRIKLTYITETGAVGVAQIDHFFVRVKYKEYRRYPRFRYRRFR